MAIEILGIRHHGVGSAIRVKERLEQICPDLILIEGPPEVGELLKYIGVSDLRPPVSIMVFNENDPAQSNFYPFAEFSPEWVAASYGNQNKIPVRAIDLPAVNSLDPKFRSKATSNNENKDPLLSRNPLSYLSQISGFENSEAWWEFMFEKTETNGSTINHFQAVQLAMTVLREEGVMTVLDLENNYREAYMRQIIRQAKSEMYDNIVVICGAWHAPALENIEKYEKEDLKRLKTIPKSKLKLNASWIPWTNRRLSLHSGYGAGIDSPGWYEHLWNNRKNSAVSWLSRIASLFRENGKDISSAHVLESFKLSTALCKLRDKSHITLEELNEAVLTVMCGGESMLLELVRDELIVNDKIGNVPDDIPKVPLQADFEGSVKSLRLRLSAAPKDQVLDLRKPLDLRRSIFFHKINILDIKWALIKGVRSKGTFKEIWTLIWAPEMMVALVDKSYLGNTIDIACKRYVERISNNETQTSILSKLLQDLIPAQLHDSIDFVLNRIDAVSTISSDIQDIMSSLPSLISLSRYGDVRKSDLELIGGIVDRLLIKVCLGLKNAAFGLDEHNSNLIFESISDLHGAIKVHNNSHINSLWHATLKEIENKDGIHRIIQGCSTRLLLDEEIISYDEAATKMSFSLSKNEDSYLAASWIEGFLRGSGMILIYDSRLWNLLYSWTSALNDEDFQLLLPYLRRAFSKFETSEKRQIGSRAKIGIIKSVDKTEKSKETDDWSEENAVEVFETIRMLMGNK